MLYPIEQKSTLPPLPAPGKARSRWRAVARDRWWPLRLLWALVLLPYLLLRVLLMVGGSLLRNLGRLEDIAASERQARRRDEWQFGFRYDRIALSHSYDALTSTLTLIMNYDALTGFALALRRVFVDPDGAAIVGTELPSGRNIGPNDPGFYTHSSLFFPQLPYELTVGSRSSGLLRLQGGDALFAPTALWGRICSTWLEVADEMQPRLIVLDRDQRDWCDVQSSGRFMIEYQPHFAPPADAAA
ncbi:MAG: hypothetical protein JXR83_14130 [Deltaproteobacteria bacterium]|nr:hypothetical protein [Deltaproteobacteria bacterium]